MPLHELTLPEAIAGTIAVALLVVQLALLRSVVLAELITLYAVGSLFVALISLAVGISLGAWDLIALAVLTFLAKVLFLPAYMRRLSRRVSTRVEIPERINVTLSLVLAAALMGVAILTAAALPIQSGQFLPRADVATTLAIVFVGFLVAILRPNALAQLIAFLTLENGLYFGTITLAPGLPFVIGVLLLIDVLIAVVVFGVLVRVLVAQEATASINVLQQLNG
jgi:hydrogenase-4 component E